MSIDVQTLNVLTVLPLIVLPKEENARPANKTLRFLNKDAELSVEMALKIQEKPAMIQTLLTGKAVLLNVKLSNIFDAHQPSQVFVQNVETK